MMICFQLERLLQEAFYYANYQKACSRLEKIKGQITENEYNDLKTIMVYASPDYAVCLFLLSCHVSTALIL